MSDATLSLDLFVSSCFNTPLSDVIITLQLRTISSMRILLIFIRFVKAPAI
jgi:hypothetical protein